MDMKDARWRLGAYGTAGVTMAELLALLSYEPDDEMADDEDDD